MLFEIIVQTFLGVLAIYLSILMLRSGQRWKMLIGIIFMAAGLVFTLTSGEILMELMGYVPQAGALKLFLAGMFPFAIGASVLAWLLYVIVAYFSRLETFGILWTAMNTKVESKSDHLTVAKNNALKDQFMWLIISLEITLIAIFLSGLIWMRQEMFETNMDVMVIALVWVFVVPPLVIHTTLKKPHEIKILKDMKSIKNVKTRKLADYRELIAVMDEITDENLRNQLDDLIVNGLTETLIKHREPEEKKDS